MIKKHHTVDTTNSQFSRGRVEINCKITNKKDAVQLSFLLMHAILE